MESPPPPCRSGRGAPSLAADSPQLIATNCKPPLAPGLPLQAAAAELSPAGFVDWPGVEVVEVTDSESESDDEGEDGSASGSDGEEEGGASGSSGSEDEEDGKQKRKKSKAAPKRGAAARRTRARAV